jgi:hypothetical protein
LSVQWVPDAPGKAAPVRRCVPPSTGGTGRTLSGHAGSQIRTFAAPLDAWLPKAVVSRDYVHPVGPLVAGPLGRWEGRTPRDRPVLDSWTGATRSTRGNVFAWTGVEPAGGTGP